VCDALDIRIIKGAVSRNHIHLCLTYPALHSISETMQGIKGRSARKLLQEYPVLKKLYWGGHLWSAWSTGEITEAIVSDYLEHHRSRSNDSPNFMLE